MREIDLSIKLENGMAVYPGDPAVEITEIHTLDIKGWCLRKLTLSTHIGTHVNVPYHMIQDGKNLDAYTLDLFFGPAVIYEDGINFDKEIGVIFRNQNIDQRLGHLLITNPPKFVGLSSTFEFDIDIEKLLLKHDIISFENLSNTDQLPLQFMFYGVPLNISGSDGSPVRAFAVIED